MGINITGVQKLYDHIKVDNKNSGKKYEKAESKKDELALSSSARYFQIARSAVSNSPEVRDDIVSHFRGRIETGLYNVKAEDIASKLLGI